MESLSSVPHHARSNSLPSISNTFASQFDEQLNRLKSSESASCSTSSSIKSKLAHLTDLYECFDRFLQLPVSQKAISSEGQKWAEGGLDESIKLLDICSIVNDVLVQMKERAQDLQSILRRRCSKDEIAKEVAVYLKSRKMALKSVLKALKDLKKIESNENTDVNVISRLRECQMVTLNVLEFVLCAIAGPKASLQRNKWESVVSKLLKSKTVTKQQENELFLVAFEVDYAIMCPEEVRSGLANMEISIKNVEQGVESLFRHLIKTRTNILNILNC